MRLARTGATALTIGIALLLCGCAPAHTETAATSSPSTAPSPSPDAPSPSASPSPSPACAAQDAAGALAEAVRELPAPFADPAMADHGWSVQVGDSRGFDPCAALSWVVVTVEYGTVSSPSQVALFHHGVLVGPATEKAYGFSPAVTRISDREIEVVYRWPRAGESNAEASGRSVSRFAWDEQTRSVVRTGDLPPAS